MSESLRDIFVELGLEVDGKAFATADKLIEGLLHGASGLVTAFAAVGAGMLAAAGFTAHTADHIDELSQSLGVSSDELQRLGYAASFSSLSMEDVGRSMKFLAKHGVKDARAELLRLADEFAAMPDGTNKTRIALERLGKTGAGMIPMLNEGRATLEEMFAEAPVLDKETIRSGVVLSDAITRIQAALKKLTFMVGAPLLAPLGRLAEGIVKWFRANEELIKSKVTRFVEEFAAAAKGAFTVLSTAWRGLDMIAESLGGWENVLTAATLAWVGFTSALMSPIAGIGLLLLLLDDVAGYFDGRDSLTGDAVKGWNRLMAEFMNPPDWKSSTLYLIFQWITQQLHDAAATFDVLVAKVRGDKNGPTMMTTAEHEQDAKDTERYNGLLASGRVAPPIVGTHGTDAASLAALGAQVNNTLTVNVNGAGDPKAVAEHVGDAIAEHFGIVDEAYRGH